MELVQTPANGLGREMTGGDHLTAGVVEDDDGVGVSGHFRFESLMLLDLGLEERQETRYCTQLTE